MRENRGDIVALQPGLAPPREVTSMRRSPSIGCWSDSISVQPATQLPRGETDL